MKINNLIHPFLISLAIFAFSCVPQDDSCQNSNKSIEENSDKSLSTLESKVECDTGDDSGGGDSPDRPDLPGNGNDEETNLDSLNSPWKRDFTSIVIDAYEKNSIDWNKMAADEKVVGVIHRSSIGLNIDTKYKERKIVAKNRGYLWGAYHLGRRGNTIAQAKLFLELINGEEDTLMILDLEDTNSGNFMSIEEAEVFMEYVYEETGRIPVVYANHSTTKILNQKVGSNPLLQQSKLWYARFKSKVTDFPVGIWNNYFLWQFSSEINCNSTGSCLYNVPGTRYDMDINVFYGNGEELRSEWVN